MSAQRYLSDDLNALNNSQIHNTYYFQQCWKKYYEILTDIRFV